MASPAQALANQVNAQRSTGPRTPEGKARASRNNLQHGLTLGVLAIEPVEQSAFCEFEAKFRTDLNPRGMVELEAFNQFIDAAWRLRKLRAILNGLICEFEADPFVHPDAEARLRPLTRYRAAAEMAAHRAIRTLRELQTTRLHRTLHVANAELDVIPPLVNPGPKIMLAGQMLGRNDRVIAYNLYGAEQFTARFANSNPSSRGSASPPA